eukprot:m.48009 g.48009  ORF g.48009 m.48009 type:complete len:247 (+) comp13259_c0_seq4:275-1015(+)
MALEHGCTATAELLIAKGVDMDERDWRGRTMLHLVCIGQSYCSSTLKDQIPLAIAEFLTANRADVNAKDEDGLTPLHLAANSYDDHYHAPTNSYACGRNGVLQHLIDVGADVNVESEYGETPLSRALAGNAKEPTETIVLLAAAGASIYSISFSTLFRKVVAPARLDYFKAANSMYLKTICWDMNMHFSMAEGASYACQNREQDLLQLAVLGVLPSEHDTAATLLKWTFILSNHHVLTMAALHSTQ